MAIGTAAIIGLGALASLASAAGSIYHNKREAEKTREWQAQENKKARQWETNMSNTAYQRSAVDMERAGLNPIAMYGSATPASTPTAVSAHGVSASGNIGSLDMSLLKEVVDKNSAKRVLERERLGMQQQKLDIFKRYLDVETAKQNYNIMKNVIKKDMKINV